MVKATKYNPRRTAKRKSILGHQNKSNKELLRIIYKLKRITEKLSKNELNKITKMQNLSLNKLKKIERMNNLSLNELNRIAVARHIKNYKDMLRKDLLIALLKSNPSHTELLKIDDSNTEKGETKKLFHNLRNNFSREELKKHREKFHKKEWIYNYLKGKDSLTSREKRVLKNIERYFKKLKKDLNKIKTYKYNITHDIRNLFNEIAKENYYEPIEIKSAFDGSYITYESRGGNDNNLSLEEYLNIIRPYLRDMIDDRKAHSEWKIQLIMKINFICSVGTNEFREMYTKSDNVEIMSGTETSDVINELFKSFFRRY